ncbi:CAP domain-containing protein [Corynebacterium sp. zg-331]|uniref:CAP domain-containing protein n=1 Tax=unclassified Corynebacterium TaxID=2624378 RepID=UPI0016425011|nr:MULTISPECIES: CAP domain-containing protein [unclassified Corynebacterium]MBC3185740.1 CAP domain-containing protein [Corynebacterium sp. zg-331]
MFSLGTTAKTLSTAALVAAMTILPAQAAQAYNCSDEHVARVVNATNNYRTSNGLTTLRCDNALTAESQEWAETMRDTGKFEHDPDTNAAENISRYPYHASPETVTQGWIDSPGHRANILDDEATIIGVGWAQNEDNDIYAVQRFW